MAKHTQTEHLDSTPVTAETAKQLLDKAGITEAEARALLTLQPPTTDELHELQYVNAPSISAAFSSGATAAIINDPKLELPVAPAKLTASTDHVRFLVHVHDKLEAISQTSLAAARVDADLLQKVALAVVPQLRSRIRVNPSLRETFSALLAYHHARFPGTRTHHNAAASSATPTSSSTGT